MDRYNFILGMYTAGEMNNLLDVSTVDRISDRTLVISKNINFYKDENMFCIFHGKAFLNGETICDERAFLSYFKKFGIDFFRMLTGYYIAVVFCDNILYAVSSKTASPSLYYYCDESLQKVIISTELKKFPKDIKILNPFEVISNISLTSNRITNIKDIYKIVSGSYIKINFTNGRVEHKDYYSPLRGINVYSADNAVEKIRNSMNEYFEQFKDMDMTCLVSGGLDSSIVATLSKKRCKKLELFCLGTKENNEFEYAQLLADGLGLKLEKILVNNEDFLIYFARTIEMVEHSHSTFIEYLIPIVMAHEKLEGKVTNLISGYGSDILFAGFAKKGMEIRDISNLVLSEFESTYWSNETSQNLGEKYNMNIYYPFFDDAVIETSFTISPELKFFNNIEKYILRYAYKDELPEQIVWRKKVGVHEGTGLEAYLTEIVGNVDKENIRSKKDKFAYILFDELIIKEKKLEEINIKEILHEI